MTRPIRLVFIVTVPVTANVLLRGQLADLRANGFDVTVISSPGSELEAVRDREGVRVIGIPIAREMDPVGDALSLARLTRELRRLAPDIVNASTAKAGLLGMLAAAATGVPVRIYMLRGLRLETESGGKRAILGLTERIAARCAHRVIAVSESLRAAYIAAGYAPDRKCAVLAGGSSNGIDVSRFARTDARTTEAAALRAQLGIASDSPVIGFVGRPVRDKGIVELLSAFEIVRKQHPTARLVLVGAGFAEDALDPEIARRLTERRDVTVVGRVDEPAPYYAMMDVLAFPSYREGFPNAPLEAAAAGVPTVGFRATGVTDAVVHGVTGFLCAISAIDELAQGLMSYVADPALRRAHGEQAALRAATLFSRARVWTAWRAEYERLAQLPVNSGI